MTTQKNLHKILHKISPSPYKYKPRTKFCQKLQSVKISMRRSACYGSKASTILVPGNTTTIALTLSLAPASRADCTNLSDSTLASCLCGFVVVDSADLSSASSGAKVDAQSVSTSASLPESTDLIEMVKYGNDGHRQQAIIVYILQADKGALNNIYNQNRKFLSETQQCCFSFLTTCVWLVACGIREGRPLSPSLVA